MVPTWMSEEDRPWLNLWRLFLLDNAPGVTYDSSSDKPRINWEKVYPPLIR